MGIFRPCTAHFRGDYGPGRHGLAKLPRIRSLGRAAGFLGLAAMALAAVLLLWLLMPETNPSHRNGLR